MRITINSTGEVLNFPNGREAVEVLSDRGIIEAPKSDKYNPFMILQGPIRRGIITAEGGGQQPTITTEGELPLTTHTEIVSINNNNRENETPSQALAQFANLLGRYMPQQEVQQSPINEDRIREIIKESLANVQPRETIIKVGTVVTKVTGTIHPEFNKLLTISACRMASFLSGPAGSGKTTAASKIAECLQLPFYAISVCSQTTEFKLLGYMDANGRYIESLFYNAYKNGGVFLIDEIDSGSANVLGVLNSALANGHCAFPCGMVDRHPDFICIAAGNTIGTGATQQYIGRNPIDAATLDRFKFIHWGYNEKMERELTGNDAWYEAVKRLRDKAEAKGLRIVISPRASIDGVMLLASGMNEREVLEVCIFNKLSKNDREALS